MRDGEGGRRGSGGGGGGGGRASPRLTGDDARGDKRPKELHPRHQPRSIYFQRVGIGCVARVGAGQVYQRHQRQENSGGGKGSPPLGRPGWRITYHSLTIKDVI